jgi:homoserine dehydrogenase
MGGEEPARTYMAQALAAGKHVVTANKEVIAKHGAELLRLAAEHEVNLFYEASVGGGIPVIAVLRHDLVANEMLSIQAIINGTTNYILTDMSSGRAYAEALAEAQRLGYAEADPRNDVEANDAAYKLAILATLAFHADVRPSDIVHIGITQLDPKDFRYAAEMGYVVKLIASARLVDNKIDAAVYPMFIGREHHLASVRGVFNAILLDGDQVDKLMLYGRGAGAKPTASSVVADLCRVAHNITRGVADRIVIGDRDRTVRPFSELSSRFYFRMNVLDRPGVLGQISKVLGEHRISIASVIQEETDETAGSAELVIMTHRATEGQVERALAEIRKLDVVRDVPSFIRVER